MNLLNYSLTAVISYLGLFVGFILAIIAKEELKQGKKYFLFLQKVILLLIFIFLLLFIKLNYILILLILVFVLIYILKNYLKKGFNELPYIYIILSTIFYISSKKLDLFVIESSLIFLYGLPTGTLITKKDKEESIINILKNVGFLIVAIVLYLVF